MNWIPRTFGGVQFKSTLEARWAVFFSFLNIEWLYEPKRYRITDYCRGNHGVYTPDFYLPTTGTWVEVKGDLESVTNEYLEKIEAAIDWGGCLPFVRDS